MSGRIIIKLLLIFIVFISIFFFTSILVKNKNLPLDINIRKEVVLDLAEKLNSEYVFPEIGSKMATMLREKLESKAYYNTKLAYDIYDFANLLTYDIISIAHDKHLRVIPFNSSEPPPAPGAAPGGIEKVEILEGNVGYIQIIGFPMFECSKDIISSAFAKLQNTDALIIDNRFNTGGASKTVSWYMSYLSEGKPYLINTFHFRENNRIIESRTTDLGKLSYGARKPVFVLTSQETISGGEELSYDIQAFKRGIIVGTVTAGAANSSAGPVQLVHNFRAFIPRAYPINPITGGNWEVIGVKPDVEVAAEVALNKALLLAKEKLRVNTK